MTQDQANKIAIELSLQGRSLLEVTENGTPNEQYLAAVIRGLIFKVETIEDSPRYET